MYIYIYIPGTLGNKQAFINGCFSWMIPNLYMKNCCFTKHPFKNWWFRVPGIYIYIYIICKYTYTLQNLTNFNPQVCWKGAQGSTGSNFQVYGIQCTWNQFVLYLLGFNPPKGCLFPIKTRVIWLPGIFRIWVFPKLGVPKNGWFIMENPMNKWMIWGYP